MIWILLISYLILVLFVYNVVSPFLFGSRNNDLPVISVQPYVRSTPPRVPSISTKPFPTTPWIRVISQHTSGRATAHSHKFFPRTTFPVKSPSRPDVYLHIIIHAIFSHLFPRHVRHNRHVPYTRPYYSLFVVRDSICLKQYFRTPTHRAECAFTFYITRNRMIRSEAYNMMTCRMYV